VVHFDLSVTTSQVESYVIKISVMHRIRIKVFVGYYLLPLRHQMSGSSTSGQFSSIELERANVNAWSHDIYAFLPTISDQTHS